MKIKEAIKYTQPTKYLVTNENYSSSYKTPVLTAGKTFILGYTNEDFGIFEASKTPVLLFDDFTGDVRYIDFDFKIKSSAAKILSTTSVEYNLKYFYYLLKKINYKAFSHKRIWISEVSNIDVDEVEYNKQLNIVNTLDNIINAIDIKKQELKGLDELIESRFNETIGDVDSNPHKYNVCTIDDICSSIVRGPFGSSLKKKFFVQKDVNTFKVYEQKNAIQKDAFLGEYYINEDKFHELNRFACKPGDFIMSCSGTIGQLYQLPDNCEKGIINQALCKFSLNDMINPIVFDYSFKSIVSNLEIKGSGIKNIGSVKYIKSIKLLMPPQNIQNDFAEFVKLIDKSKLILKKQIKELQELFDSKMDQYFG